MGCIYSEWIDKSIGEIINSFSIITTEANPLMDAIHNLKKQIPLIIDRTNEKAWIDPKLPIDRIKELIKPYNHNK